MKQVNILNFLHQTASLSLLLNAVQLRSFNLTNNEFEILGRNSDEPLLKQVNLAIKDEALIAWGILQECD